MTVVQLNPTQAPPTAQSSFRKMVGELLQWNPDLPVPMAKLLIQNSYRRMIDERQFYGTLVKGVVNVPNAYTTGTVTVTQGSPDVTGVGTNWTNAMIGQQFRIGFSTPIATIANVLTPTSLVLDLPWGLGTQSNLGYQIFQNIVSFGANIKRLLDVANQIQGYRLALNIPQTVLYAYDTWRTNMGWTILVANFAPSPTGAPQFELYPPPTYQQSFPFLAYTQPADLSGDNDAPPVGMRSDVIMYGAIAHALLFRGKQSKYYDPTTSTYFQKMYMVEIEKNKRNDNDLYQKDLEWEFSKWPLNGFGASFWQSHEEVPY
jgi:hypothetical protein